VKEIIEQELIIQGIRPLGDKLYHWRDQKISLKQLDDSLSFLISKNKKTQLTLWIELSEVIKKRETGDSDKDMSKMFIPALKGLYLLSCNFDSLRENGICDVLKAATLSDVNDFSRLVMNRVIEFRLSIDWLHHLIRSDMYLRFLLKAYNKSRLNEYVVAGGVSGPWANLDLPMQERVFKWDEIEEETAGRGRDKRNQRRYTMGLENYGTGDHSPNEGFVWRELRNEPYEFDDASNNPYPHRNTLWI